jgi:hypothetical protein
MSKQGAVANISPCENSVVEGVLYDVETLVLLDKYEGHPKHYTSNNEKRMLMLGYI